MRGGSVASEFLLLALVFLELSDLAFDELAHLCLGNEVWLLRLMLVGRPVGLRSEPRELLLNEGGILGPCRKRALE